MAEKEKEKNTCFRAFADCLFMKQSAKDLNPKIIEAWPITHPYPFLSSPTRAATPSAAAGPLRPADA